jgi:hypothetical protein
MTNDAAFAAFGPIIAIAAMARHDGNNRFIIGASSSVGLDTTCRLPERLFYQCGRIAVAGLHYVQRQCSDYALCADLKSRSPWRNYFD